jgi:hypothetical protein
VRVRAGSPAEGCPSVFKPKKGENMKKLIFLLALIVIGGCASLNTLSDLQEKFGPPGKIEGTDDTTTYFYYFYKGKSSGGAIAARGVVIASSQSYSGWITYEFTADKTGTIIKKRKYWAQPEAPMK